MKTELEQLAEFMGYERGTVVRRVQGTPFGMERYAYYKDGEWECDTKDYEPRHNTDQALALLDRGIELGLWDWWIINSGVVKLMDDDGSMWGKIICQKEHDNTSQGRRAAIVDAVMEVIKDDN